MSKLIFGFVFLSFCGFGYIIYSTQDFAPEVKQVQSEPQSIDVIKKHNLIPKKKDRKVSSTNKPKDGFKGDDELKKGLNMNKQQIEELSKAMNAILNKSDEIVK